MNPVRKRAAMSLIEVLVVIAILGVLTAILLAAVQKAREAADRAGAMNNLHQIGLALHLYVDVNGSFPVSSMGGFSDPSNAYTSGWLT